MAHKRFPFTPARWRLSQKRLRTRLCLPGQAQTRQLAAQLQACCQASQEIFQEACPQVCPACAKVCCLRISPHGILEPLDLVQAAALDLSLPYPPGRGPGCPFLTPQGCALPWPARPHICLRHVCPTLAAFLGPERLALIHEDMSRAADLRARLMSAYLEGM